MKVSPLALRPVDYFDTAAPDLLGWPLQSPHRKLR